MTLLIAALRRASDGQGATLVIRSDAASERAGSRSSWRRWRTGRHADAARCMLPGDRAGPSAWVSDMLRRLASDAGDAQAIMAEAAPAFAGQVPELNRLSTTVIRGHLLDELPPMQRVPYVHRRLAGLRPTLLIVEDLHWSDASGIEALVASARATATVPLVVVATTVATMRHSNLTKRWLLRSRTSGPGDHAPPARARRCGGDD